MKTLGKALLGALTILPWLTMGYFFVFMFDTMGSAGGSIPGSHEDFMFLMGVHMLGVLVNLGVTVFNVVHVLKYNDQITEQTPRLLWAVMLFFGNIVANPIYFFLHILPEKQAGATADAGAIDPRDGSLA